MAHAYVHQRKAAFSKYHLSLPLVSQSAVLYTRLIRKEDRLQLHELNYLFVFLTIQLHRQKKIVDFPTVLGEDVKSREGVIPASPFKR